MSPFFRGSVRPPRKHPRPWSLNPRLNPDIAKDGHIDAHASIYGVGTNKEAITLPVHNGIYNGSYDKSDEDPAVAVVAEKKLVGHEPPVEEVVVNAAAPLLATNPTTPTETTGKESESKRVINDDWPLPRAGSPGIARTAETAGLETAITREEHEAEGKGVPITAQRIDNKAPEAAESEEPKVETPEEPSRRAVEDEAVAAATAPAPSSIEIPETGEKTTEAVPVAKDSTVNSSPLTEIASLSPTLSKAAPLETEAADTMAPQAAEPTVAEQQSAPAELPFGEKAELKETSNELSNAVAVEPAVIEEPASASVDTAPQPRAEKEASASEAKTTNETPVIQKEKPAQTNETGTSLPVERNLTPPPERYQLVDSGPVVGEAGTREDQQFETDDESAAEAPFIPDHRHTPPSSRKSSRGEEDDKLTETTPIAAVIQDSVDEVVPQTATVAMKDIDDTLPVPVEQEDASVANEEPLMSIEQLDVSDEFRPGVQINPDADD